MKNYKIAFIISIFSSLFSFAQLPNTDIWLMDISQQNNSFTVSNPVNITNRNGYDNQPTFSPDGKYILFTSIRDEKQSDIFKYDLISKLTSQFITTPTSEYSPTFMPDGKNISVVMVEEDSTQRLWKFPISGGNPNVLISNIDSIGYHCWLNKDSVALVMITEPPTLEIVNIKTQKIKIISKNCGRCMASLSPGTLDYVEKQDSTKFWLSNFDNSIIEQRKKFYNLPNEDFAFLLSSEPFYITGKGGKLYASFLFQNKDKEIFDLTTKGIKKITRVAVSKDGKHLAVVAE